MDSPVEIFSELTLFVCTYVAKLGNINVNFEQLTHKLCKNLYGQVLAINSNYGHASQPGHESFIKYPKVLNDKASIYIKGRTRKIQGDGTCFNSAIEPVIKIDGSPEHKYYYIKCFPTTGETQIPGVIKDDFSDGHQVLTTFIEYLNSLQVGIKNDDDTVKQIYIDHEGPKMLNYKFKLNRENNRILINLISIADYLILLEQKQELSDWIAVELPFEIKEIKSPVDDIKVSFRFQTSIKRAPRINIFQEGKINILGAESIESAELIYIFLTDIFKMNWTKLINIKPEKDKN